MKNILLGVCALGIVAIAWMQFEQHQDRQSAKEYISDAAAIAEHCRIMAASGVRGTGC
jgi:hypothetical protein